ncbi:MAG: protein DpdF [Bryobacteraceae bacterium]
MIALAEFQKLLSQTMDASRAVTNDHLLLRLQDALGALTRRPEAVGTGDLAVLIRQAMIRAGALSGEVELRVPNDAGWPNEADWSAFGCDARLAGKNHYFIRPRQWTPPWLDEGVPDVIEAGMREENRRQDRRVASDPLVIEFTGLTAYVSPGQRAAVQAAFFIPKGSTAVISLPTGGGKTLAFQLPALAWADQGGTTLVVTPTTALAKDQEERFRALMESRQESHLQTSIHFAYHGGLDDDSKNAILASIHNGTQPIVFASPEAVMGALRVSLFSAARQGRLRYFVVDEAHIITQWGQQFRPEFQTIAGLKDALLDVCPPHAQFRTLLLTATLSSECYETLTFLFGRRGCQLIAEVSLRAEPGFLLHAATTETERTCCIMEAIRHLPRPLILYTTLREHAEGWFDKLRHAGFHRLRMVRGGDLSDADGDEILKEWQNRSIDIVVATSAFGLGMDQAEVRSVVHACLPETIDRYYQEVGRAGRDGKAAVSLLVSTPDDLGAAEALGKERLISVDRGFERWEAMWLRRRKGNNDTHLVSLDARPADVADTSIRNASWNLRTLVLMSRSGLIGFSPHEPAPLEPAPEEAIADFEHRRARAFEQFSREVALRIEDPCLSDKAHWNGVVARTRISLLASDEEALMLVRELRHLQRPLNDIFREIYTLTDPYVCPPMMQGNCPVTRDRGTASIETSDPDLTVATQTNCILSDELLRALSGCSDEAGRSWVANESMPKDAKQRRKWLERVLSFLRYAVAGGVAEVAVPEGLLSQKDWSQLMMRSPYRFLIRSANQTDRTAEALQVPRLTVLDGHPIDPAIVEQTMMIDRPRHIILLPPATTHPRHLDRRLLDMLRHGAIEDILLRLQS